MEKIEHTTVATNGINMHVASIGTGPEILFLHGFPELWYSWRHQMIALSSQGYRCIAPDLRGYGDTDAPVGAEKYTSFHIVGDLVGLLDALGIERVLLVGHDWGAGIAWSLSLFRPDLIKALVNTSVPYMPRHPKLSSLRILVAAFGEDFYMSRFQEAGATEAHFGSVETGKLMTEILTTRSQDPRGFWPKEIGFGGTPDLPAWLSQEDVKYFASKYDKSGFTGPLNYYRSVDLTWELMAPWTGAQVKVPTKFIVGEFDLTLGFPGMEDYIRGGGMKKEVPLLEEVVVLKGVAHFLNQESPDQVSKHIYDFFKDK